jgi:hypothetical protein
MRLYKLADALVQEEHEKDTVLTRKGELCSKLYFLYDGRIDLFPSLKKVYCVTTLKQHSYVGMGMIHSLSIMK